MIRNLAKRCERGLQEFKYATPAQLIDLTWGPEKKTPKRRPSVIEVVAFVYAHGHARMM